MRKILLTALIVGTALPAFASDRCTAPKDKWRPVDELKAELTAKKLQRSTHRTVRALNADIRAWIETWNDNPRPYVWVKTADQILDSIAHYCARINDSDH